ncbi:MAG TPA: YeeE/YedE thiosulfate transporter family protein [Polyangiaceae bacterium]
MAPFDIDAWGSWATPVVHIVLGVLFGFVLERAGFGNATKLAAQFYLRDMTVLKVMFTGIITAMLLIHWTVGFGALDLERLWVNPTYLGSGIVGGLLFGVGFVIGGYCPGTALVALATLKLDGLFFVLGVLGGILLFGFTVEPITNFWHHSGALGTFLLYDWLGLSPPVVIVLAVLMALGMFAGAEALEQLMRKRAP